MVHFVIELEFFPFVHDSLCLYVSSEDGRLKFGFAGATCWKLAHLVRFRSMCVQFANFWSLLIWGCKFWMMSMSSAMSYVYTIHAHVL